MASDRNGLITFNEVLYSTLKRAYHRIIYQNNHELAIKQLEMADEKTRFNLQMKKEYKKRKFRRLTYSPQEITDFLKKIKEYNPLPTFFFSVMTFYAWKNYTDIVFEKLIQLNLKNESAPKKDDIMNTINDGVSDYSEEKINSDSSSNSDSEDRVDQSEDQNEEILFPSLDKINI